MPAVVNEAAMRHLSKMGRGTPGKRIAVKLYATRAIRRLTGGFFYRVFMNPKGRRPSNLKLAQVLEDGSRFSPLDWSEENLRVMCTRAITELNKKQRGLLEKQREGEEAEKTPEDIEREAKEETEILGKILQGFHEKKPFGETEAIQFIAPSTDPPDSLGYKHLFTIIDGKVTPLIDYGANRSTRVKYLVLRILNGLGL
jgi:hypothetical protein